jgi:hypothetical protein
MARRMATAESCSSDPLGDGRQNAPLTFSADTDLVSPLVAARHHLGLHPHSCLLDSRCERAAHKALSLGGRGLDTPDVGKGPAAPARAPVALTAELCPDRRGRCGDV